MKKDLNYLLTYLPTNLFTLKGNHSPQPSPARGEGVNVSFAKQTVKNLSPIHLFTHYPNAKAAFTLGEVLITLAIIGVVAALTIPSLIEKHKKTEIETGLKKAYNSVQNAIRLSEIDNGPYSDWNEKDMDAYKLWNVYLKPYFKDAVICNKLQDCHGYKNIDYRKWHDLGWNIVTDNTRITFQLPDGTVIFWMKHDASREANLHSRFIIIDANGAKGPNKGGVDVFQFERDLTTGKIYAAKGGDCKTSKMYCAYEIISNGWKFPDNYPIK